MDNGEPEPDIAIARLLETIIKGDSLLRLAMLDCWSSHCNHHPYSQDIYWLDEDEISNRLL